MKGYIYLASPYSHPDPAVRHARYEAVVEKTAVLLQAGHFIFAPILHNHPIAVAHDLPGGFDWWREYDTCMIAGAERLWVYRMDGWAQSVGVAAEIKIAVALGKPVEYID